MNIGIDMMGGDYSPLETAKGVLSYLANGEPSVTLYLFGDSLLIEEHLAQQPAQHNYIIVHASQVISMHDQPAKSFKEKPQSSIVLGFDFLANGAIDAFISAGNTGAMMMGALFTIKSVPGILRPTISTILPKENGKSGLLLDVGLNADCKPEHLNQFAMLGALYARHILNIEQPVVGLLNIGEEESKGNLLAQSAYPLLAQNKHIRFIGNVEGRDILTGTADVMVCDGYTGNIILKLAESLYNITDRNQNSDPFFKRFNFEDYGGTPVLGISKPVIIGHGISHALAFDNMIRLAVKMIETDLLGKIAASFNNV